jgi:CDP-4-dehydro-6-deoxyglucose reductase, E1
MQFQGKKTPDEIRDEILSKVEEYYFAKFGKKFVPGETFVQNSGKSFDQNELKLGVQAVLDGWWTEGRYAQEFSRMLCEFLPRRHVLPVNSGSSANLVAFASLTSHLLENRIKQGDEVITVAAGFPTTVNPIITSGCIPVFVDVNRQTLTAQPDDIEKAISDKTKCIFMAHPLGNPFNAREIRNICKDHGLWLIEDSCDALGSKYDGKNVGTFGDISTFSFYPAHHITTGEGGAVSTDDDLLRKVMMSVRDWGRDCICPTGMDNTCKKRFQKQMGDLPYGYDHKFIYSHLGFNLKMTDFQAAIGVAQMPKLQDFAKAREKNFAALYDFFSKYSDLFYLPLSEKGAQASWFGYPVMIREDAPFTRSQMLDFLASKKIGTRLLFAGNIVRQPYFKDSNVRYRVCGSLENTDFLMNNMFWVGVQPQITCEMNIYMQQSIEEFLGLPR